MNRKIIVAVKEEINNVNSINGCDVLISGVGKINACLAAFDAIKTGTQHIINIGSCGSLKHNIGTLLNVNKFYHDIDLTPLCNYGYDLNSKENYLKNDNSISDVSCFTTDTFYDKSKKYLSKEYLEMVKNLDCIDMESYAIAKVCKQYNIKFTCYKWVSDDGNDGDWLVNKEVGYKKFKQIFK